MSNIELATNPQETWGFSAPWGKELLLHYQQKFYFCTAQSPDLNLIKQLVDQDRQAGFDAIMVYENNLSTLWCALPTCFQTQLHQVAIAGKLDPLSEPGDLTTPEQRSWLDMVRLLNDLL